MPHGLAKRCLLAALLALSAASLGLPAARAGEAALALQAPELVEGALLVRFTLSGIFDEDVRASLDTGLPATLAFRWQLWQEREGWWDRGLEAGGAWYRIFYDVLERRYQLFDASGRRVAGCATLDEVDAELCREQGLRVPLPRGIRPDRRYFLELEARLEPLDVNEIRDLEGWLGGSMRESGSRGLMTGASRYAVGMLKKMAGMGSRRAQARSEAFAGG
jgi:hypothetical protein